MRVAKQDIPSGKPSEVKDFYVHLGVSRTASPDELKRAYRSLVMQWHPDHNPGRESESKIEFIAVSEAYEALSEKPLQERAQPIEKDYEFYNNFYQDLIKTIEKVSPELAAATRLFCGNSMPPGLEVLFRDFYGK